MPRVRLLARSGKYGHADFHSHGLFTILLLSSLLFHPAFPHLKAIASEKELANRCTSSESLLIAGINEAGAIGPADQSKLNKCIKSLQQSLGISPDLAFYECKGQLPFKQFENIQDAFLECKKRVLGKRKMLRPIREYKDGYLVDLGPYGSSTPELYWQEGDWWKRNGCQPLKEMEHHAKVNLDTAQLHRWFRYGKCRQKGVEIGRIDEMEARKYCDRKLSQ